MYQQVQRQRSALAFLFLVWKDEDLCSLGMFLNHPVQLNHLVPKVVRYRLCSLKFLQRFLAVVVRRRGWVRLVCCPLFYLVLADDSVRYFPPLMWYWSAF